MSAGAAVRTGVRTAGELCITAGVLVLLFLTWQLWWTDVTAGQEARASAGALREQWQAGGAGAPQPSPGPAPAPAPSSVPSSEGSAAPVDVPAPSAPEPPVPVEPGQGEAFALVHVPRFGQGWQVAVEQGVVLDGVLDDGVLGHYPGTAMPGAVGNFSLAGHRTTYGKPLSRIAELQAGDPVVVETAQDWYVYRVREALVVLPSQVEVIAPDPGSPGAAPTERLLTLTACHPRYSARERYVVHAVLESWQPRGAGDPRALAGAEPGGV
ncbi:class E sortase [Quadrisphaera sp. DSM 44207]|uniref:class E sortase n=1 Tax=Quadrisphaera sp. DSM 44207 TaxID=1881057 RepID=UPI00088FE2A9|nr:class E sortase [Quadrisphaera sp. DSM 44207]SDQ22842.1 sortase A [Quadrisphaera sp. DSM 44207]